MTTTPAPAPARSTAQTAIDRLTEARDAMRTALTTLDDMPRFGKEPGVWKFVLDRPDAYAASVHAASQALQGAAAAIAGWTDPDAARGRELIAQADANGAFVRHGAFRGWGDEGADYVIASHHPSAELGRFSGEVRLSAIPHSMDDLRTLRVPEPTYPTGSLDQFSAAIVDVMRAGRNDRGVFSVKYYTRQQLERFVDRSDAVQQLAHQAADLAAYDAKVALAVRTTPRDGRGRIVIAEENTKKPKLDPKHPLAATLWNGKLASPVRVPLDAAERTLEALAAKVQRTQ